MTRFISLNICGNYGTVILIGEKVADILLEALTGQYLLKTTSGWPNIKIKLLSALGNY